MASRTTTDPIEILLEMGIDLDNLSEEEDYLSALKEAIAIILVKTKGGGDERSKVLLDEVVKVRKSRKAADPTFKARKKKISADSFKKKTSSIKALPGTSEGGLLDVKKTKISAEDIKSNDDKNILESILGSVTNISDMLKEQYKLEEKDAEKDRKSAEKTKRKLQESGLEKAFKGLAKTTEKVIAPVKSLLDKIFGFIKTVLLARFLNKFIDWFADPDNRSKIKSIIRFLGDNWPKLLSAYIIFGTGLGKFSRFIVKLLAKGAVRLAAATAGLLARLFGGRALGKFSRFLGKRGKLIAGGIEAVTTIIAFKALEDSFTKGLGPEESAGIDNDIPTQGYQGGGLVQPLVQPILLLNGGGQAFNLLNPLSWFGGDGQKAVKGNKERYKPNSLSGKLLNRRNATNEAIQKMRGYEEGGEVDGAGGIDKVPAMLTDGEFVMSRGAVQKFGVGQLEAMNASGGGTNKPKMMNNMVYASVGGYVSGTDTGKKGTPDPKIASTNLPSFAKVPNTANIANTGPDERGRRSLDEWSKMSEERQRTVLEEYRERQMKSVKARYRYLADMQSKGLDAFGRSIKMLDSASVKIRDISNIEVSGGSGAKKYQETKKGFEAAAATSKVTPKATPKTLTAEQLLGKSDVMPTTDQLNATATKRHAELMNSTHPNAKKRIADYDAEHGEGAYSKELKKKLNKIYTPKKAKQMTTGEIKPTGKVVGRENLPLNTQKILARMDAQRNDGLQAGAPRKDSSYNISSTSTNGAMEYTKDGKKISAEEFNRIKNMGSAVKEGGVKGALDHMVSGAKGMFGGMFGGLQGAVNDPKSFVESMGGTVKDGNKGIMSPEIQKDFEKLDALTAEADKLEAKNKMMSSQGGLRKSVEKDPLFAEYEKIQDDINHPLHDKVAGDLFDDTGTKNPMRFSEFKKLKAQQGQAKLSANQPSPAAPPGPPPKQEPKVVVADGGGGSSSGKGSGKGGSTDVNAANPGSGSKSKWNILGIPMPF